MGNAKMAAKLKAFDKNFKAGKKRADELGGFGSDIDDGKYLSQLSSCELKETNAGDLNVVFTFGILEAADEKLVGKKVSKWASLDRDENSMGYLIRDLRRFGMEPDSAEEIGKIVDFLDEAKPEVKITLKTKDGGGQFCYIDKLISELEIPEDIGEAEGEGEEETPAEEEEEPSEEEAAEEEAPAEEETSIEIGMTVQYTSKSGQEMVGEVTAIKEAEGKVNVKVGDKTYAIEVERLSLPEAEEAPAEEEAEEEAPAEEEEEEAPVKAAPKKTAAKPVAKKPAPKAAAKPAPKAVAKKSAAKRR